ncbi:MAG: hypothetical protein IT459_23380 [Planctomycetes bacterium]|nr:hypothetical protein [Planctomycetota bacterium]
MKLAAIVLACVLASCAAPVRFDSPSGRPEVLADLQPAEVRARITNGALSDGLSLASESSQQLVFERPMDGWARTMYSSDEHREPVWRVTFTLVEKESGTRVVCALHGVANPHTANEHATDRTATKEGGSWADAVRKWTIQ